MCCTPSASTRSVCPPSSTRCRRARIPRDHAPRPTSSTSAGSWAASASGTTRAAASPPPTSTSTSGRSGSSCRSTTPGSTRRPTRPGRSPSSIAEFESGARPLEDGRGTGRSCPCRRAARDVVDSYRLVYRADSMVNWCPGLGTVLANEEVTVGRPQRPRQLPGVPEAVAAVDDAHHRVLRPAARRPGRTWTGPRRSRPCSATGSAAPPVREVQFATDAGDIEVFTTRPDTLFGATYMVLAPEHRTGRRADRRGSGPTASTRAGPSVRRRPPRRLRPTGQSIAAKSDLERQENKAKTGVFLGSYATNPVNGQRIPVFIADYVLIGYGTGAIMAVPGGDQRDWDFATEFGLPIVEVISGGDVTTGRVHRRRRAGELRLPRRAERRVGQGGDHRAAGGRRPRPGPRRVQAARLAVRPAAVLGRAVPDRLRRRRPRPSRCRNRRCPWSCRTSPDYAPVHFDPDDADSEPSPPLGKATDWVHVELDLGDGLKPYTRDTNVMPQWAGSSWYELRYADPHNSETFCAKENEAYWMGPRPAEHGAERSRRRRPVRRRCRACGAAPAVFAVLAQGAATTSATSAPASRTAGWSTRATSRRSRTPTRAAPTCPPPKSSSATASSSTRARRRGRGQPGVRQDRQEPEELGVARRDLRGVRRRHPARLRDVDGPAGGVATVGHQGRRRRVPLPAAGVACGRRRGSRRRTGRRPRGRRARRRCGCCTRPSPASRKTMRRCGTTPPRPS